MDLPLLRTLQSIKKIEEDASFQTKRIDPASFKPMYPNEIIVNQKAVDGVDLRLEIDRDLSYSLLFKDECKTVRLTNTLSKAMHLAAVVSGVRPYCFTIVLMEGLYIDPVFDLLSAFGLPGETCIEIVGLNNVRILHGLNGGFKQHRIEIGKLTMRNVRLYDRRRNPYRGRPFFGVNGGAQIDFIDVKVNVPDVAFLCVQDGAAASFKHCALHGCHVTIQADGASIRMEDSMLSHCGTRSFRSVGLRKGGSLSATRVRFVDCSKIFVWTKSYCVFNDCQFQLKARRFSSIPLPFAPASSLYIDFPLFQICAGATVECNGCEFRGYDGVSRLDGSNSKVTLKRCLVSVVIGIAQIIENASIEIVDCHIDSKYLLKVGFNVKGKMTFLRNTLSASSRPLFLVDQMSNEPCHDLRNAAFELALFDNMRSLPRDKERSSYTNSFLAERLNRPVDKEAPVFYTDTMKACQMCVEAEGQDAVDAHALGKAVKPSKKFRFCAKCRQVCYCSKECQIEHWPDHKLSCSKRAAPRR